MAMPGLRGTVESKLHHSSQYSKKKNHPERLPVFPLTGGSNKLCFPQHACHMCDIKVMLHSDMAAIWKLWGVLNNTT